MEGREPQLSVGVFHPGYLFKEPVIVNEFSDSHVQNVPFTSEFFDYGDLDLNPRRISKRAHYAGFRLLFPLNEGEKFDEVVSFLGASYFRALGQGQRYGKSARALAINTGMDKPEEFPIFREFWIGNQIPRRWKSNYLAFWTAQAWQAPTSLMSGQDRILLST